jgi:hypothetical protein
MTKLTSRDAGLFSFGTVNALVASYAPKHCAARFAYICGAPGVPDEAGVAREFLGIDFASDTMAILGISGESRTQEKLVFFGPEERHMSRFLRVMRRLGVPVPEQKESN